MFKRFGLLVLAVSLIMQAQASCFENLPIEIKVLILNYVVNANSLHEAVKAIELLKLVNKDTRTLMQDSSIVKVIQQKFDGSEDDVKALRQRQIKLKYGKARDYVGFLKAQYNLLDIFIDEHANTITLTGKTDNILKISEFIKNYIDVKPESLIYDKQALCVYDREHLLSLNNLV